MNSNKAYAILEPIGNSIRIVEYFSSKEEADKTASEYNRKTMSGSFFYVSEIQQVFHFEPVVKEISIYSTKCLLSNS